MEYLLLEDLEREKMITLGRGNIISKIDINAIPGNYPIYSSSATGNGEFGRYGKYMFEDERVTWSIDGGGRPFYREKHKYSVTNVCGWLKINTDKLITKFVYYCLLFQWNMLKFDYTYKAHPSIIKEIYRIPMLPISIQKVIVEQLDKINNQISKNTNTLLYFEELTKSRFIEMFGSIENNIKKYSISKIEDLCILIKDGTHQTPTYVDKSNNSFKFLSSKDVMSKTIDWSNIKYIPESLHKKLYAAVKPQKNDILMSKNGVNYGVAAVNDTNEIFDIYVSLALLRPNLSIITPEYFSYALNDDDTKQQFKASIKGVGVPNLHLGEIKKAKILVPPIKEQLEFIYYTKQIDKLKFTKKDQLLHCS